MTRRPGNLPGRLRVALPLNTALYVGVGTNSNRAIASHPAEQEAHCEAPVAMHVRSAGPEGMRDEPVRAWDQVDQAVDESFPASDPPTYIPLTELKKIVANRPNSFAARPPASKSRSGRLIAESTQVTSSALTTGDGISAIRSVSRLIKAAPIDADAVISAFEARATTIQKRDGCTRITALQRVVDENPERFAEYCRAMHATRELAPAL